MNKKVNGASWPPDLVNAESSWEHVETDTRFHIGSQMDDDAATTIRCRLCGAFDFNVGVGQYFTAIRCSKCGWEECIHSG